MTTSPPQQTIGSTGPIESTGRSLARQRKRLQQGFTLIELMAVVAMIGVLAALAIVGYQRYLSASHSADAKAILGAIRIAEETYRAETLVYLGCSANLLALYPAPPNGKRRHWVNPGHVDVACWRMLNVATDSPTRYGFAVVAGAPGGTPPQPNLPKAVTWGATTEPWYVVQARGDNDDDNDFSTFVTSSFSGEVVIDQEAE
ncbi:MAG: prepilin-type N-terminal cleavage/methylation domain-containing protein [Deltaproteobacteria bacterium]|nr:prepilin-type N-terminal cleavage/methylation domain-containing protein [Deltaproteobacteria bacterium]